MHILIYTYTYLFTMSYVGFPGGSVVKNLCTNTRDTGSFPGLGRSPKGGNDIPIPVFLPGNSLGQKSLVGYSPWGCGRVRYNLVTKQKQHNVICISLSVESVI